ncbi:MAG: hypothetical protein ACKV2V_18785 [Blastocatellia bacterium]
MNPTPSPQEQEDRIIKRLLQDTLAGTTRWGLQPPTTLQTNQGKLHFVLRMRKKARTYYKLTGRRDGSKVVNVEIERREDEADLLTQLFRAGAKGRIT